MDIKQITFTHGTTAHSASISDTNEIQKAFELLGLAHPKSVIVLIGGAGGIEAQDQASVQQAIKIVAKLAEETDSAIIDGGTQAGIMLEVGQQRMQNEYSFPLIGVLPDGKLINGDPLSILESNHTQFIFTPGLNWGDESAWIAKTATMLAGSEKSITILINGGEVSKKDVDCSLAENRPTIVIRGTGRMADRINMGANLFEVNISLRFDEILSFLKAKLS